jgi:hypothetical protein
MDMPGQEHIVRIKPTKVGRGDRSQGRLPRPADADMMIRSNDRHLLRRQGLGDLRRLVAAEIIDNNDWSGEVIGDGLNCRGDGFCFIPGDNCNGDLISLSHSRTSIFMALLPACGQADNAGVSGPWCQFYYPQSEKVAAARYRRCL